MPRGIPAGLRALGRRDPPARIEAGGHRYELIEVFKHDFFAATARYAGPAGHVVLKIGRQADILGLPAEWIGRLLSRHEARICRLLGGLPGIPDLIGLWGRTGLVHAYVEGHPLRRGAAVPDDFFEQLERLIRSIHDREAAYVDLEKPENVLLGDDGRPHLIDFQISYHWPARWGGRTLLARWIRGILQRSDLYHVGKLHRRLRPDQLSAEQMAASYAAPLNIRLHRILMRPLTRLRRRVLARIDPRKRSGERGRVEPGDPRPQAGRRAALRCDGPSAARRERRRTGRTLRPERGQ